MISKERLEELIEQGATIYDIFKGDIYIVDLTMAKYYDVPKYVEYKNNYYNCNLTRSIEDLFETKEDAEWCLEFGNIERTEKLTLPTWEELKQKISSNGYGNKTIVNFDNYVFEYKKTKTQSVLRINLGSETLFYEEFTLKNYTDACELAKKLFLGEKE